MQQAHANHLSGEIEASDHCYIEEQWRQAKILRQIDRAAAGIKSGVTICAVTLGLFLAGKVLPFVSRSVSGKSQSALLSTIAATDSYKKQTLAVTGHDIPQSDTNSIQHVSDSLRVDGKP
jgi:hypothetical protein